MEPVTHALAGLAIAGFSGQGFSLTNFIYLSSLCGALAPDLDIVLQFKGHIPYLRYHRGPSHSVPGLFFSALAVTLCLGYWFPEYRRVTLFFWAMSGALSHSLLDSLNSHGAKLFWPINNCHITFNLLTIFDPVLFMVLLGVIVGQTHQWPFIPMVFIALLVLYLGARWVMSRHIRHFLRQYFAANVVEKIIVLPAMMSLWNWFVLVETPASFIAGEVRYFSLALRVWHHLIKQSPTPLVKLALDSKLGRLFTEFTPIFHVFYQRQGGRNVVRFLDLRYYSQDSFLHSATLIFDRKQQPLEGLFHPYNSKRKVKVVI
ncbi:MAG: metal-dependent hydrolase [bacterium]|jgi:inner membrane protein